jgi:hypothetical protein
VFKYLGKLGGKLHLEVTDNVRHVQLPPRPWNRKWKKSWLDWTSWASLNQSTH